MCVCLSVCGVHILVCTLMYLEGCRRLTSGLLLDPALHMSGDRISPQLTDGPATHRLPPDSSSPVLGLLAHAARLSFLCKCWESKSESLVPRDWVLKSDGLRS